MKKSMSRALILLGAICLIGSIFGFVMGNFLFNLALNPESEKSIVFKAEHNALPGYQENPSVIQNRLENDQWFTAHDPEDCFITSEDGLRLHAYALTRTPKTDKWIVVCHGYTSRASHMKYAARRFYDMGFNVLMPDARAHGESEGRYIGMGWPERKDIVQWTQMILERTPNASIVLYGISMGAGTVMMAAGEETLPENVKALVEDCGYSSAWDEFSYQLKALFKLPEFPVLHCASLITRIRAGYWIREASAVAQIAKAKIPMFFIHGEADTFVPSFMANTLYNAAPSVKEKMIIGGAGHAEAASVGKDAYWNEIARFINLHIDK